MFRRLFLERGPRVGCANSFSLTFRCRVGSLDPQDRTLRYSTPVGPPATLCAALYGASDPRVSLSGQAEGPKLVTCPDDRRCYSSRLA